MIRPFFFTTRPQAWTREVPARRLFSGGPAPRLFAGVDKVKESVTFDDKSLRWRKEEILNGDGKITEQWSFEWRDLIAIALTSGCAPSDRY